MGLGSFIKKAVGGITGGDLLGFAGGLISSDSNKDMASANSAMQKEFAQNGIRWKVADAQAAGIHPLYAMGANTVAFNPVSTGDTSIGSALSSFGQDVSRSIHATRTSRERDDAIAKSALMDSLKVRNQELQNDLLSVQIAKLGASPNPPMPASDDSYVIPGQGNAIRPQPLKPIISEPGMPHKEVGYVPDFGYTRTSTGYAPVMSNDAKERLEEDFIGGLTWNVRNRLLPMLQGSHANPPPYPLPKGRDRWYYDPVKQEYRPASLKRKFGIPIIDY